MAGRLQEIFENAVGLQGPAREEYLNSACGTDESLRAEVVTLLRVHDRAPKFLASPTRSSAVTITPIATPREHEGEMIGRYKLLQPIGEGGFGSVWMAEQREPVKRRVALKIIKLGMDTRQVIARFEAERQALALMEHPNIAKVLDAGSTEAGRPFFVMEYIKGVPILEYCDTERLDTKARLDLFMKVCHAIQHAHQKGIIHRDIKPSNVLITMHDGVPVPKVIDFGIAKATNTELTQKTLFTEHRQMIGTPAYMSPEQAEMSGLDIDTRSDVYSLGVLLYELLTGTTPFATDELMSKGFAEMMRIIREVEPHKPSTRLSSLGESGTRTAQQRHVADPKKLGLIIKGDLDWIVMKCLEKDRTRRYETANGLAADINRHLNDEPVTAGPPSASYKLRKFVKRNRGQVIAVCVLTLALLAAFVGASWGLVEANRARSIRLQQQLENEQRTAVDNARLGRNAEAVTALLSQCDEALRAGDAAKAAVAIEAARKRSAEGGAEKDAERLSRLSRDLDLLVELDAVDQVRWGWTVDGLAGSLVAAAIRNRDALKKFGVDPEAASVESMAAAVDASVMRGRIVAAVDRLLWASRPDDVTKTVHGLLRRLDPDPFRNEVRDTFLGRIAASEAELKSTGAKLVELAMRPAAMEQPAAFAAFLGDFNAIPMARRVELMQAAALRRPNDLGVLINLSNSALGSDGHSKPIDLHEALRWSQAAVAADPTNAAVYNNLGVSLLQNGRIDEAIACYQQAIVVDPMNGMAYGNLGNALEGKGRVDEAIAHHRKSVELDPKTPSGYFNLGNTLSKHGRQDEAVDGFRKAIELNPKYSYAYYGLGTALGWQGKLAEALDAFKKAIECNPRYLDPHINAGTALNDLGRLDEAIGYFEKAIELDPKCAMAQANLGSVFTRQGRYVEAIAMCRKAIESDPKLAQGYYTLAGVYSGQGPLDDAVANFRKAIECDPNHADAHCNLGQALQGQGHYEEALAEYKRGHELGSKRPGWRYPSAQWILDAEAKIARAAKLPAFLRGEYQPSDNAERLEFAYICQNTQRYHAATGVYAAVLAADSTIGKSFEDCVRFNAACVAVLSAAGKGEDVANLSDDQRTRLRKQALDWLRADLDDATRKLESGNGAVVPVAMRAFVHQADLVSIRDAAALSTLPADERQAFTQLWADVAALLARATSPLPPTSPPPPTTPAPATPRAANPEDAVSSLQKALKEQQALLGPDHRDTLFAMGRLAQAYLATNKPDLGVSLWEETLRLAKARFGVEDPFTLDTMRWVGAACWSAKQLDKSVPLFEECLKLHVAKFGRDNPTTLGVMADLGVNYKDAGRLEDAIPLLEEAHQAATDHPELSQYDLHLLDAYAKAADPAKPESISKVVTLVHESLAAARATLPTDSPELAGRLATFSLTLLAIQAWDEAEPLIREALTIRETNEPNDWRTFNTRSMLGGVLLGQKKLAEAEPLLLEGYRGVKEREAAIPPQGRVRIPEALERLVRLYEAKGNESEAAVWRSKLDAARAKIPQASGADGKKEGK